jgi:peptidylprolyl isomerase domain and WD repeat-containing protein 1
MINMITLPYVPKAACWIHSRSAAQTILAISEDDKPIIRLYDGRGDGKPFATIDSIHRSPVTLLAYNEPYDCVVSADDSGMIEYWQPRDPFSLPDDIAGLWQFKSSTDLYEFKKTKSLPASLTFNPQFTHFVTTSLGTDRQIRIFNFLTGKIHRKYDESLTAAQEMQQAASKTVEASHGGVKLDDMEFGRRLAVEKELEKSESRHREKAVWDESGTFVLYPTLLGIKGALSGRGGLQLICSKSGQYCFKSSGPDFGQRRKPSVPQSEPLPRDSREEAPNNSRACQLVCLDATLHCARPWQLLLTLF